MNLGDYAAKAVSFLARNFYTLKYVALVLAFCINFVLLFYKVASREDFKKLLNWLRKLDSIYRLLLLVATLKVTITAQTNRLAAIRRLMQMTHWEDWQTWRKV